MSGKDGAPPALTVRATEERMQAMREEERAAVIAELRRDLEPHVRKELADALVAKTEGEFRAEAKRRLLDFLNTLAPQLDNLFQANRTRLSTRGKPAEFVGKYPGLKLTNDGNSVTMMGLLCGLARQLTGEDLLGSMGGDGKFVGWHSVPVAAVAHSAISEKPKK